MSVPLVRLEVAWQGNYSYNRKLFTGVEIKQKHCMQFFLLLLAKIDKKLPAEEEQPLAFTVKHQSSTYCRRKKSYLYRQFDCPVHLVKELNISVNMRTRKQKGTVDPTNSLEGSKVFQRRGQDSQVAVQLPEIPELDPAVIYQLKITHEGGKLQAALARKVHIAAAPYLMQEEDPPIGLEEMNESRREEARDFEKEPEPDLCSYLCSLSFF